MGVKFLIECLATWRLANLLVNEKGPGNILQDARRHIQVETVNQHGKPECDDQHPIFGMFCCTFCMSIWTAALMTKSVNPLRVLAVSAGALLVDRVINS